jgi:N-methylhydantoinase A/oxoprolinase/acetone carboxylase beta subunit
MEFVAGVAVGGTFTDLIMVDGETRDVRVAKVSPTPGHQAERVMAAMCTVPHDPRTSVRIASANSRGASCGRL